MDLTVLADSLATYAGQLDTSVDGSGRAFLLDLQNKALGGFAAGEGTSVTQSTVPGSSFMFQVDVSSSELFTACTTAIKNYDANLSCEGGSFDFLGMRFTNSCFPH